MEFLVFFFRFFALQLGFLVVFVVFLTFAGEIKKKKNPCKSDQLQKLA